MSETQYNGENSDEGIGGADYGGMRTVTEM